MGHVLFSFYISKDSKKPFRSSFHHDFLKSFTFHPSFLVIKNKTKPSFPDGNEGNIVFLTMWAMFHKIRSSYNSIFLDFHFLEVQNKPYVKVNFFTFSHLNLLPMIDLFWLNNFWTRFMIRFNRFGRDF